MADKDIYKELIEMINREDVVGIPESPDMLKVLSLQFTPEEAKLALKIGLTGGTLDELSQKLDMDREALRAKLNTMADKGTMWIDPGKDNPTCRVLGSAAPGLVETGIWGGIRFPYDVELARHLHKAVVEWARDNLCGLGFPFGPVWAHPWALPEDAKPEENLAQFLKEQDYFSLSFCPCRLSHWIAEPGEHCEHMLETCLHTGDTARWCVEHGQGREITYEDALELLKKANADGLVHTININGFICNCCDDCCPMFVGYHQFKEKTLIPSPFIPEIDVDDCVACGECADVCAMNAVTVDETATVDLDVCIGCGLCVTKCPSGCVVLIRRPEGVEIPEEVKDHIA